MSQHLAGAQDAVVAPQTGRIEGAPLKRKGRSLSDRNAALSLFGDVFPTNPELSRKTQLVV